MADAKKKAPARKPAAKKQNNMVYFAAGALVIVLILVFLIKGGCNPVPILDEDKSDDGTDITIPEEFLNQSKELFENWKK